MPVELSQPERHAAPDSRSPADLLDEVRRFDRFGTPSAEAVQRIALPGGRVLDLPMLANEYWTSKQRAAHSLHEISYRACFKPQLPAFFIDRLTAEGDRVYDPFMGRGTTLVEAALRGRVPAGCDVNPLSAVLVGPRLAPPSLPEIEARLSALDLHVSGEVPEELLAFYHPETLAKICALKEHFLKREQAGSLDAVDGWIRMVAINRLTGHSPGFFSVRTMPPNQAVSLRSQQKINERRQQVPPRRDVAEILVRKSRSLLRSLGLADQAALGNRAGGALLLTRDSRHTPELASESVALAVTSPPFLDVVDYATDNWLRCWFIGLDAGAVPITMLRRLEDWQAHMTQVFRELARVLRPGGHVAFEVGEVRGGKLRLEEAVVPCAVEAGLEPLFVLVNQQEFTKTANCWGVDNNSKGTNTNRIVLARRPG